MLTFNSLEQNHNFLLLETIAQFRDAMECLETPQAERKSRMSFRNELIRNMKNTMENDCFQQLFTTPGLPAAEVQKIRSLHRMALACRRIANHCVNICNQARHMQNPALLHAFAWRDLTTVAGDCLNRIPKGLENASEDDALAICRGEETLDVQYDALVDAVEREIRSDPENFRDHLRVILIGRYMEAIGDELLRIGEALLSALVGERIQYYEYEAMRRGLERLGGGHMHDALKYKAFWGSRSGCVIGMVTSQGRRSIFKEGPVDKVRREKDNMLAVNAVWPGLAPEVYVYSEQNDLGSMLMEEVGGKPLDEILLHGNPQDLDRAVRALTRTMEEFWNRTASPLPSQNSFMDQVRSRLGKIRQVHASLHSPEGRPETVLARIEAAAGVEESLRAPLTVRIHGDCNLNNLFYDAQSDALRLVDLYRSRPGDYLQDISVNMVSAFRLPVFDPPARARITDTMRAVHDFAAAFAARHGDTVMSARLALALARSLITSTRFELRRKLTDALFHSAYAMLDALLAHAGKPWEEFKIPLETLRLD